MQSRLHCCFVIAIATIADPVAAQSPDQPPASTGFLSWLTPRTESPRVPAATPQTFSWRALGSEQLWSDVVVYGAWRVQRNEISLRFRLLDPADIARAEGTEELCRSEFDRIKKRGAIAPLDGSAVITLHGFGRSRDHMESLGRRLCAGGDFTWINVAYSSTRGAIDDHAATLASVIDGLEGIDEIHFVCHSLGNLVVRRYLGEAAASQPRWTPDPRIKRMVMLGPPNQGARIATLIAELVNDSQLAQFVTGKSAWQIARQWEDASQLLATPDFEFGIIAGGLGDQCGLNVLVPGDDDLVVSVAETRLPGAADFRVVPCRHGRMMRDEEIQQLTERFLEEGYFTTAEEKRPIRE